MRRTNTRAPIIEPLIELKGRRAQAVFQIRQPLGTSDHAVEAVATQYQRALAHRGGVRRFAAQFDANEIQINELTDCFNKMTASCQFHGMTTKLDDHCARINGRCQ